MSKKEKVLNHLKIKAITPLEALKLYGSFRLSAIIFDLKKEGHTIFTDRVNVGTQKNPTWVAKYSLIQKIKKNVRKGN